MICPRGMTGSSDPESCFHAVGLVPRVAQSPTFLVFSGPLVAFFSRHLSTLALQLYVAAKYRVLRTCVSVRVQTEKSLVVSGLHLRCARRAWNTRVEEHRARSSILAPSIIKHRAHVLVPTRLDVAGSGCWTFVFKPAFLFVSSFRTRSPLCTSAPSPICHHGIPCSNLQHLPARAPRPF